MRSGKRKGKKIWITLGIVLLGLVILIAALPVWFPWVLHPVLRHLGGDYTSYERVGYGRFILRQPFYSNDSFRFEAKRLELYQPLTLAWRHFAGPSSEPCLEVADWQLDLKEEKKPKPATPSTNSVPETVVKARDKLPLLKNWLPVASFTNGVVRASGQEILIPFLRWNDGRLSARLSAPKFDQHAVVEASLPRGVSLDRLGRGASIGRGCDRPALADERGFRSAGQRDLAKQSRATDGSIPSERVAAGNRHALGGPFRYCATASGQTAGLP